MKPNRSRGREDGLGSLTICNFLKHNDYFFFFLGILRFLNACIYFFALAWQSSDAQLIVAINKLNEIVSGI